MVKRLTLLALLLILCGIGIVAAPAQGSLAGHSIALNPGHGSTWNYLDSAWEYQRVPYWGIFEDTLNDEIVAYLNNFLLYDGATTFPCRELSKTAGTGASGLPTWMEGCRAYAAAHGAPDSVVNPYPENQQSYWYQIDTGSRPRYANWKGAELMFSLHNNGGGGTGSQTLYDTNNGQQGDGSTWGSQWFANLVQNRITSEIRANYYSSWYNRGATGYDGNYGENQLCAMPSCLVELAFMDMQVPDNNALHDEAFKSLASWAMYEGICDYFKVAPLPKLNSTYVSDDIPATMVPGTPYTVHVRFKNVGPFFWTDAGNYRLGAVGDSDPFAGTRQTLGSGVSVAPYGTATYTFTMVAPNGQGDYTTDWKMVQDGVAWFGETLTKTVNLSGPYDTTPPSAPASLTATGMTSARINLVWTAATDNLYVGGYKVYRDGTLVATLPNNVFTYSDTGLTFSTSYNYSVTAIDGVGNEGPAATAVGTTRTQDNTPPTVPAGVTAMALDFGKIKVSWSASTDDVAVAGYKVYRDGAYLATVTSGLTFTDTGLGYNEVRRYSVSAYDAAGNESAQSAQATATTMQQYVEVFHEGWNYTAGAKPPTSVWTSSYPMDVSSTKNHGTFTGANSAADYLSGSTYYGSLYKVDFGNNDTDRYSCGKFESYVYETGAPSALARQSIWMRSFNTSGTYSGGVGVGCYNPTNSGKYYLSLYTGSWNYVDLGARKAEGWRKFAVEVLPENVNVTNGYIDDVLKGSGTTPSGIWNNNWIDDVMIGYSSVSVNSQWFYDDCAFYSAPPQAPIMTTPTATATSITWKWLDQSNVERGFYVQDTGGTNKVTVSKNIVTATESSLTPNTAYTRKVTAHNGSLRTSSGTLTAYTLANVPNSVAATPVTGNKLRISWGANSNPAGTNYKVKCVDTGAVVYTGTAMSYDDPVGDSWLTRSYTVSAVNGDGVQTAQSSAVSATSCAVKYATGSPVNASPSVYDGIAYIGDDSGKVHAILATGANKGQPAWASPFQATSAIKGRVSIYGTVPGSEKIFFGTSNGTLYSLNMNGSLNWQAAVASSALTTPAVRGGYVYVGAADGTVSRRSMIDGSAAGSVTLPAPVVSSPAIPGLDFHVIVGTTAASGDSLYCLSDDLQVILWTQSVGSVEASPTVEPAQGSLYIGSTQGTAGEFRRLHIDNGNLAGWASALAIPSPVKSTAWLEDIGRDWNPANDVAYFGSDTGLYGVSVSGGSVMAGWPIAPSGAGAFQSAVVYLQRVEEEAPAYLYAGSEGGKLYAVNLSDLGTSVFTGGGAFRTAPSVSGATASDVLVVGCADGNVYFMNLK